MGKIKKLIRAAGEEARAAWDAAQAAADFLNRQTRF